MLSDSILKYHLLQLSLKKLWLPTVYSGFQKLLLESISHQKS